MEEYIQNVGGSSDPAHSFVPAFVVPAGHHPVPGLGLLGAALHLVNHGHDGVRRLGAGGHRGRGQPVKKNWHKSESFHAKNKR